MKTDRQELVVLGGKRCIGSHLYNLALERGYRVYLDKKYIINNGSLQYFKKQGQSSIKKNNRINIDEIKYNNALADSYKELKLLLSEHFSNHESLEPSHQE